MPKKSTEKKLVTRDPKGYLHADAAFISKALKGTVDYTAGTAHALSFTAEYYRRPSNPINYKSAPLDLLRDYAVHGSDFVIRRAALEEIERRYIGESERISEMKK